MGGEKTDRCTVRHDGSIMSFISIYEKSTKMNNCWLDLKIYEKKSKPTHSMLKSSRKGSG